MKVTSIFFPEKKMANKGVTSLFYYIFFSGISGQLPLKAVALLPSSVTYFSVVPF